MNIQSKNKTFIVAAVDVTAEGMDVALFAHHTDDELRQTIRRMEIELLDRKTGLYRGVQKADLNECAQDAAPRQGSTIVIHLEHKGWSVDVYAPGYAPIGSEGLLSAYASRPHGSTGIGIDALLQQGDWRFLLPQMKRAEQAYEASFGSGATE